MNQTFVALDLETTGLDPKRDAIIEIGCVKFRGTEIVDEWHSLVNPGRKLPFVITQITGIADRELIGKPRVSEVLGPLSRFIGTSPIAAHNASFDLGFLREAGLTFLGSALDTFEIASIVLPGRSSLSLGNLAAEFDIDLANAHRAPDDARATGKLLNGLAQVAAALPLPTLIEINRLAAGSNWSLRPFFVDAEKEAARTVFLKKYERAALESGSLGPLLNPAIERRMRFDDALTPVDQAQPLDVDLLAAFLQPNGPLAQVFPGYEHRAPQVEMLRAVADAFNDGDHLLIEAGTGTGKSLAYLLPAIAWAVQNRRRVVVSTNTINLQDQLCTKDIPDLEQVFATILDSEAQDTSPDASRFAQLAQQAKGLQIALMKGRGNYLCPRRLDAMRTRQDLGEDELRVLARILVWLTQTTTGDRAELFLAGGRDQAVWSRLATESGTCSAERCETSQGGRCFFYRNRRQADAAHIIVVNHALLFSDVAVSNRVLPEYHHLIVDEAHHLEDATTQQLSFEGSQAGLTRMLNDLYPDGGDGHTGLFYDLRRRVEKAGLSPSVKQALDRSLLQSQQKVELARDLLRDFFTVLGEFMGEDRTATGPYGQRLRIERKVRAQPGWTQVEIAWDTTGLPLYELAQSIETLRMGLTELEQTGLPGLDDLIADFSSVGGQLSEAYLKIHAAVSDPQENDIYWAEADATERRLSIHVAPLHVGPLVEQHLFNQKDNVILTSATLRTADSYSYIQERLHARTARTATVGSPFNYKKSTLIYLPTDLALPDAPGFQTQVEAAIRGVVKALGGRTLALFTSYNHLRQTAEAIGPELAAANITVLQQGSGGSRRQILENFRANPRSVLFGTRSFWEGVDVVGPALSGLVITRLPFAVPNDPIVAARAETFDDAFYQYSVPDAILRFRQGFGRLIRSQQDRGICVILDNRVITKRYGQLFLQSLPDATVKKEPLALLSKAATEWLGSSL